MPTSLASSTDQNLKTINSNVELSIQVILVTEHDKLPGYSSIELCASGDTRTTIVLRLSRVAVPTQSASSTDPDLEIIRSNVVISL